MAYSTLNDFLKEFSAADLARYLGDPNGLVINLERLNHSIDMADVIIDFYTKGRYSLPLGDQALKLFMKISLDLAIHNIFEYGFPKVSVPGTIQWRKSNAMKLLEEIKSGIIILDNFDYIKYKSNSKVFNEELLDDFADIYQD